MKRGQIAHLDRDPSNSDADNLAFLCLEHHDQYDSRPSQSKGFSILEAKQYRATLIDFLISEAVTPSPPIAPSRRHSASTRSQEAELRRSLKLRDRMRRDFFKPPAEIMKLRPIRHPYDKFAYSKVIIRRIGDTTYPDGEDPPGAKISGWFRVEPYDFYHNGFAVILGIRRGIIDRANRWKVIGDSEPIDSRRFAEIRVWHLGRIPWRNIREYDLSGDEYYNEPHIYCAFADDGMPYEDFAYAMLGEDYDWPLSKDKRLDTEE